MYYHGFSNINAKKERIGLDAGGLLFHCALMYKDSYLSGNYCPALQEFMSIVRLLSFLLKWRMCIVFDGCKSILKRYEYERRSNNDLHITSRLIALAAKVCHDLFVPYIVAHEEADPQCLKNLPGIGVPTLIVTGDSDLLAYGAKRVIIVHSWSREEFRVFDLHGELDESNLDKYPLLRTYHTSGGEIIFQLWAACCGCDFTPDSNGLRGVGPAQKFLRSLRK